MVQAASLHPKRTCVIFSARGRLQLTRQMKGLIPLEQPFHDLYRQAVSRKMVQSNRFHIMLRKHSIYLVRDRPQQSLGTLFAEWLSAVLPLP